MDPLACVLRRLRATETPENRSVFRIQECILLREQHTSFADRQPSSGGSNQRCAPLLTNLGNTIYRLKMLFIPYNVSDLGNQLCSDSSFSPPCMSFPIPLKGHHLQYLTAAWALLSQYIQSSLIPLWNLRNVIQYGFPILFPHPPSLFLNPPSCGSNQISIYNRTKNNSILLLFCQKNMGSFEDNWIKRIGGQS